MTKIDEKISDRLTSLSESKSILNEIIKAVIPVLIHEITKTINIKDIEISILKCLLKDDVKEIKKCIESVINELELEPPRSPP